MCHFKILSYKVLSSAPLNIYIYTTQLQYNNFSNDAFMKKDVTRICTTLFFKGQTIIFLIATSVFYDV
jgi:hypothetical protein